MGVRHKSESSCQTQLTIPPFITKKKIRDSKSYMKNLHFPRILSAKDVNILQTDSQSQACIRPTSDDTIENIVMYEHASAEKHTNDTDKIPGVESRRLLSYKSFFQQNKFSRNNYEVPFSARLQPKEEPDSDTREKPVFVKDNLRIVSEVSDFLKYLRRKGTDFLTMFDLDNLNSLIDDISNMKHFAEPVSYEDNAATLRTESSNRQELVGSKSSEGTPHIFRRSLSVNIEKTPESTCDSKLESTVRLEEKSTIDEMGRVSFDSAKHKSLHSAVRNPVAMVFGQEVDEKCLPRGKALKCVTVTRDKHVRVYIKGKSTCTTIDLCPEYLSRVGRPKPDVESASEELVNDISLSQDMFGEDSSSGAVKSIINVSADGGVEMRVAENTNGHLCCEDKPVSEKREQTKSKKCEILTEFKPEALQQRLLFLEVCKKLNKAKICKSESCSSGMAKGVYEYSDTQNSNILHISAKDWKTEFIKNNRMSDLIGYNFKEESASDSSKTGAYSREEESVTTINQISHGNINVQRPHSTDRTSRDIVCEEKVPPRLVKSDLYIGHEFCFRRFNRNADMGGLLFSDHFSKTNEAKRYVLESSLTDGTVFANKVPSITSKCEKVDTFMVLKDDESKLSSDLKGDITVSAEKISLQNKISYLDVTEELDKDGNELEEYISYGDSKDVSKSKEEIHADSITKTLKKNLVLEIVSHKKKTPKYEMTVRVSSAGKSDDSKRAESKQPSIKSQKGNKLSPYALGSICSKSANLVVSENVSRLLERVVKSSVELEKFDFTFANFNQIFIANVGRNLETPSSSDIDVTRKWNPEARERFSKERVNSNALEYSGQDVSRTNKSDSQKRELELDSDQSSANRPRDWSRPCSFYRKKYMKQILFASEENAESEKNEDSSNLESSQSNISSVFDAVSDTQDTKVRFLEEDLVCSKIYPRPKSRCDFCVEESKETPEDSGICNTDNGMKVTKDRNKDFLTTVEEISRDMSEEFISIKNKMNPATSLVASSDNIATPVHSVRFDTIIALNSARTFAHSSLLNADLERLKNLCEDAIKRHSRDDDENVDDVSEPLTENELSQVFDTPPIVSALNANGSLEHSYCGTASGEESYCEEENSRPTTTTTTTTNDAKSQLYRRKQNQDTKVHSFMTTHKSDKSLTKEKNKFCVPSGSGYPRQNRMVISCKTAFNAEECTYNNAKRVENLVQKLCQKLNVDNPHTFKTPESFVTHFERVGKRLYSTPIEKLKSDLKLVLGKGSKETKPQFRKEDAFRQRAKLDSKREPVDRNAKMREKIAKIKRK